MANKDQVMGLPAPAPFQVPIDLNFNFPPVPPIPLVPGLAIPKLPANTHQNGLPCFVKC